MPPLPRRRGLDPGGDPPEGGGGSGAYRSTAGEGTAYCILRVFDLLGSLNTTLLVTCVSAMHYVLISLNLETNVITNNVLEQFMVLFCYNNVLDF